MINVLEVGDSTDGKLTVTLSGEPKEVIKVLASGLPMEDLPKIQEAIGEELIERAKRR